VFSLNIKYSRDNRFSKLKIPTNFQVLFVWLLRLKQCLSQSAVYERELKLTAFHITISDEFDYLNWHSKLAACNQEYLFPRLFSYHPYNQLPGTECFTHACRWWSEYLTQCSYYDTRYGAYADPSLGLLANCSDQGVCIFRQHRLGVLKKCHKTRHQLGI